MQVHILEPEYATHDISFKLCGRLPFNDGKAQYLIFFPACSCLGSIVGVLWKCAPRAITTTCG